MKKKLITMLLTFSLLLSATSSVFATENLGGKSFLKNKTDAKSLSKEKEDKEQTVVVVLKENAKIDYETIKTPEGKKRRIEQTKPLREAFINLLNENSIKFEKLYEYDFLFAGFALKVKNSDIDKIKSMKLVESVEISVAFSKPIDNENEGQFDPDTDRTVDSNNLIKVSEKLQKQYNGTGKVVAVLDTGVDVNHPVLRVTDVTKGKYPTEGKMKEKMKEVGINYGSWRNDKVVYAHNYSTNGKNVKQVEEESHGMHVSGTAVGNPKEDVYFNTKDGKKGEKIIGVAPEAQLIFMGVFDGAITYTHMYAKALEDAVKLGADSVNLSLGSPNGTEASVGTSMDKAIEFARNSGVIVAIAAGNDGHFGCDFKSGKPPVTNPDYGTIGSPGTSKDALTVAAMYTTVERVKTIKIVGEKDFIKTGFYFDGHITEQDGAVIPVNFVPDDKEQQQYDVVSVGGIGNEEDFTKVDVKDKIALIERGVTSFAQKIINAQNRGAKGVIIYNHEQGGEDILNMMFGDQADQLKIPSVFIGHQGGEKIKKNLDKKIEFSKLLTTFTYPKGGQLTDFSSYGLTTDGIFKPDITAPGGIIYSSINNNKYVSMNGTSMATPHVAGACALIREAFNKRHPEIKGKDEYDTIKAIMMSTADPIKEGATDNYFSPRKQGSGALNVEKAVVSDLYVVDEKNNPKAFLGNIENDTADIKLKVKNIGKEDRTLSYNTVLSTDNVENGKFALSTKTLETIKGQTITVPKNGEKEVTITIDAKKYDESLRPLMPEGYFLEGYVFFNESDGQRAISIPFNGFRGSWSDVGIWEKPIYDFDLSKEEPVYYKNFNSITVPNFTQVAAIENNPYAFNKEGNGFNFYGPYREIPLGLDMVNGKFLKDKIAFSPNGDSNKDFIEFKGVFFRNAQYLYATVEDENKKEIFHSGGSYVVKNSNNFKEEAQAPRSTAVDATAWYGKDIKTNKPLKDGHYKYKIHANADVKGAKEQVLEFDVILDNTKPKVDFDKSKLEGRIFTPSITDNLSGIERTVITYKSTIDNTVKFLESKDGKFEFPNDADLNNKKSIAIHTFDYAGNILSINLDKTEYKEESIDLGANIRPIFNVTNLRDIYGNHIKDSEKLNLFPIEIDWRNTVGLFDKAVNNYIPFNYNGDLINVKPGNYNLFLSKIPEVYEPLKNATQEVSLQKGQTIELKYETKIKDEDLKGNGEYTVELLVFNNNNFLGDWHPQMSYKLKNEKGEELNRDDYEKYVKLYNIPNYDANQKLVGVRFDRRNYTKLPEGKYIAEITSYNKDEINITEKTVKFEVKKGKTTVVPFKGQIKIKDVVNIIFDYASKIPEGTKVILVDKAKNEIEIKEAEFNKKVFSQNVLNGEYTVKIVLPDGYKADKEEFKINVNDNKVVEVVKLKKVGLETKDKDKEVIVENKAGFKEDVKLNVKKLNEKEVQEIKEKLKSNNALVNNDLDIFDISLENNEQNNDYNVKIKKAKGRTVKNVYYVNDVNKKATSLEELIFTEDKDYVSFSTNHFSKYALEYETKDSNNTQVTPNDQNKGDDNNKQDTPDDQNKGNDNQPQVTPDDQNKGNDNQPQVTPNDQDKNDNKKDITLNDQDKNDNKKDITLNDQDKKDNEKDGTLNDQNKEGNNKNNTQNEQNNKTKEANTGLSQTNISKNIVLLGILVVIS